MGGEKTEEREGGELRPKENLLGMDKLLAAVVDGGNSQLLCTGTDFRGNIPTCFAFSSSSEAL